MATRIYKTPFAATGDKEVLATADQPDGKVSLQAGWTPDYELPNDNANYRPVGRAEMNGVFNELTEALGEMQLNGFAKWQSIDGGWPLGAQVSHNGTAYRSTTNANVTTPGSTGAAWVPTNATAIADVTGLQAALDGKQPKGDYQPAGNYQPALGYAPVNKAGDTGLGSMQMVAGGDINSSSWGGWLSSALNSKISTADLPAVLANLPTGGVGTLGLMMADSTAGQTGPGATASGAHLRWSSAAGQDWGKPAGTWRCLGGSSGIFNQSSSVTLWQRVA